MSDNSLYIQKLSLCNTKIHSLEDELGKLKAEHLSCGFKHRRLEREVEIKKDELENLTSKLGFNKDAEAKAIARCDKALEYNREVEAKVGRLIDQRLSWDFERRNMERKLEVKNDELEDLTKKLGFSKEAEAKAIKKYEQALEYNREVEAKVEELLGKLSDLKGVLMERDVELGDLKDKLRRNEQMEICRNSETDSASEGKLVGENGAACDRKRISPAYIQKSERADVSSDASNHSDDSFTDASNHKQDAEQTNIQIFVRPMFTDKIIAMTVEPSLTIGGLKFKIQNEEGIPPDSQRLIFAGMQLEDSCTLAHYNIGMEASIDLILRLGGPCRGHHAHQPKIY
ncbi:uncharacterized protein LOC141599183 [Silene latifolia]|uniref:uncharacterized protein LOC141599183 n=1 Tax=Silene latifolia TaxID=37657 RepID=UPI003D7765B1